MTNNIVSFYSVGPLRFDASTPSECVSTHGVPVSIGENQLGMLEYHYPEMIFRFDRERQLLVECTMLPFADASIDGLPITWDKSFLHAVCKLDGSPLDCLGFIVLLSIGIAVTGIHDDDPSQLAVTIFRRGAFDGYLKRANVFPFESLGEPGTPP